MSEFHGESIIDLITDRRSTHTVIASCSCAVCSSAGKGMEEPRNCMGIQAVYMAYTCDECDFPIRSNVVLRHHMTTHVPNAAYQCIICGF